MNTKTVIANIGLMTGAKFDVLGRMYTIFVGEVRATLKHRFGEEALLAYKVEVSETEETLVVSLQVPSDTFKAVFEQLSKDLRQEAIAYYVVEDQKGYLVGEYAEEWGGEFKPEYFLI